MTWKGQTGANTVKSSSKRICHFATSASGFYSKADVFCKSVNNWDRVLTILSDALGFFFNVSTYSRYTREW